MITQTDLFAPANEIIESEDISHGLNKALAVTRPIAVPCGFRDRRNSPCKRLETGQSSPRVNKWFAATDPWSTTIRPVSMVRPQRGSTARTTMISCGTIGRARMATSRWFSASLRTLVRSSPRPIRQQEIRCPCCSAALGALPQSWTIDPCATCRRPLALVRMSARGRVYRLCNVLDHVGTIYGVSTLAVVIAFALFDINAWVLAKAIIVLLFVIASMLITDGVLGLRTSIDRSWNVTHRGTAARIRAAGKVGGGVAGFILTTVGIAL